MAEKSKTQKAKKATVRHDTSTGRFIVGRAASAKISRVEGLVLSRDMRDTFRSFDEKSLANKTRRSVLIGKYGKKGR